MNFAQICLLMWIGWYSGWLTIGFTARNNANREPFLSRLPHLALLVAALALVFAPAVIEPRYMLEWTAFYRSMALAGVLGGLGFACWARAHLGRNWSGLVAIKEGHELVSSGPYRLVRHPIYTGLVLAMAMTALSINTYGAVAGALLWFAAFVVKLQHEERLLTKVFGAGYVRLCAAVPDRLVPGVF